jgi:hypothetical protein
MKNIFFFLIMCSCISINTYAQFSYPIQKVAIEFQKRTLIVELQEKDEKYMTKLKKKDGEEAVDNYVSNIDNYNRLVKESFPKYWKTTPFEFKTKEETDDIVKSGDKKYAVFSAGWRAEKRKQGTDMYIEFEVYCFTIYLAEKAKKRDKYYSDNQGSMNITRGPHVFKLSLASKPVSEADFKFIIQQFQLHTEKATTIGKTGGIWKTAFFIPDISFKAKKILKEKKLSIPKDYIDFGEPEIKEVYKHPFELTASEKEEQLILDDSIEYAYINYVWSEKQQYWAIIVVDIESGEILARIGIGGVNVGVFGIPTGLDRYAPIISYRSKIFFKLNHLKAINRFIGK